MRALLLVLLALALGACATTESYSPDDLYGEDPVLVVAQPEFDPPAVAQNPAPPPAPAAPPVEDLFEQPDRFAALPGWATADLAPALAAFRRSCASFLQADPDARLNPNLPQYGRYRDWQPACFALDGAMDARRYFETHFAPAALSSATATQGLLTGYYEPEVEVRLRADAEFSEPILAKPADPAVQRLPRKAFNARSSRVIAYGRPIDVFFLQIQGSGRLRFADGRSLRAAYAANNGQPYRSIGRVLIERGELTRDQSAKRNIEAWMEQAGPKAARALMNENPRYIFFVEQAIRPGEGPNGAMRVPLTAMGSIAVDPRYHPYGTLAFLNTKTPTRARDYRGADAALLVAMQDTGSAIKGPLRGDLFFGAGDAAGALAGVQKHPVRWTLLLPKAIAPSVQPVS